MVDLPVPHRVPAHRPGQRPGQPTAQPVGERPAVQRAGARPAVQQAGARPALVPSLGASPATGRSPARVRPGSPWPPTSFLGALTPGTRAELLAAGSRHEYAAGETLIAQGDLSSAVYVLLSGATKITAVSEGGDSALITVRVAGDLIGELAMIENLPRSATATAARPVVAQRLSDTDFRRILRARTDAAEVLQRILASKLRATVDNRVTQNGPARTRLARLFLDLADQHGRPLPGATLIDLPLSQLELGSLISASEPTVNKAIRELKRMGAVDVRGHRRYAVRDAPVLRRIIDATAE